MDKKTKKIFGQPYVAEFEKKIIIIIDRLRQRSFLFENKNKKVRKKK